MKVNLLKLCDSQDINTHSYSHDGVGEAYYGRQKSSSNASEISFDQNYDISKWFITVPEASVKYDSNGRQVQMNEIPLIHILLPMNSLKS